jgi:hypothetical protein
MGSSRWGMLALSVSLLAGPEAGAQGPAAPRPLGRPTAVYQGEFALIRGIRELADGSILVADPIDGALRRIDAGFRRTDTLGRTGKGPGEYIQPDGIWPMPGDASLLVDLGNNRLTLIDPQGKFGESRPITQGSPGRGGPGSPGRGGLSLMLVAGADRFGNLYFRGPPGEDSVALQRLDWAGKHITQVARLLPPSVKVQESGGSSNRNVQTRQIPLSPADGFAVAPSGLVYLVRAGDYHVEVIPREGAPRRGPRVPFTPVRLGAAERTEWQEAQAMNGGLQIGMENRNGEISVRMSRGRTPAAADEDLPWPETKPAFDPGQVWVDGRDRLWVRRHQAAGRPPLYDVFNDRGVLVGSVVLPERRLVVGMGATSVYVVRVTEDDLQMLERYPLPL